MAIANNQIETNENKNKEKEVKQYIVVQIGSEKYGIDISYVDNIVRMQKITRVPKAQEYFKGIINLRGEIVPVMSIRLKMGLEDDTFTSASRIIILKIEDKGSLGVIVDEVCEVVNLSEDQIENNMSLSCPTERKPLSYLRRKRAFANISLITLPLSQADETPLKTR